MKNDTGYNIKMESPNFQKYVQEQEENKSIKEQKSIMLMKQKQQMMEKKQQSVANPFVSGQYRDIKMPDMPISYGGGMADSLLNDTEVPENIRKQFWYVFHKDNTLTFLDEERKQSKMLNFDITKIDFLNSIPYYDYDFDVEMEFGILRNVFETKLDRALGVKGGNIKNERLVLQSQFSENRQINENDNGDMKEGFFKRLLGRR